MIKESFLFKKLVILHRNLTIEIRNEMNTKIFALKSNENKSTTMCMMPCCCKVSVGAYISYGL